MQPIRAGAEISATPSLTGKEMLQEVWDALPASVRVAAFVIELDTGERETVHEKIDN
jgi:hypothetical protein